MSAKDIVNQMHTDYLKELSVKVLPNKSKYSTSFQTYITQLVALAKDNADTDAEAVANAKAMLAIYQKIVNYAAGVKAPSTLLKDLLSANQLIKTRTKGIV